MPVFIDIGRFAGTIWNVVAGDSLVSRTISYQPQVKRSEHVKKEKCISFFVSILMQHKKAISNSMSETR